MPKCKICNYEKGKSFQKQQFLYFQCTLCKTISMNPEPNEQQILNHYKKKFIKGNYELAQKFSKEYLSIYKHYVNIIKNTLKKDEKLTNEINLLDIGCFTGDFIFLAQKQGWNVTGYELQEEAVLIAEKKLPGKVHKIDVYDQGIKQEKFDVITLFGVIEHVLEPLELIKRLKLLLKKDGYLFIQTPNSLSIISKVFGKSWPPISPIEQIHIFSDKYLIKFLERQGFKSLKYINHCKHLPIEYVYANLSNFGPCIQNYIRPLYNILPNFIKKLSLPFYGGEMILIGKNDICRV
jgi:2-polyprenyl-3-methyl-5-hydroxy-6-metoxy-1,4-benzoquinol methylase